MRLTKEVLLLCEVAGVRGKVRAECYNQIEEKSPMKWKLGKNMQETVNKTQKRECPAQMRMRSFEGTDLSVRLMINDYENKREDKQYNAGQ